MLKRVATRNKSTFFDLSVKQYVTVNVLAPLCPASILRRYVKQVPQLQNVLHQIELNKTNSNPLDYNILSISKVRILRKSENVQSCCLYCGGNVGDRNYVAFGSGQ